MANIELTFRTVCFDIEESYDVRALNTIKEAFVR